MYGFSYCAAVKGIEGCLVCAEADVSGGLPQFSLVGFLSSEVKEARERVQIGMKNAGFCLPPKKITVNLSPAAIKKGGTSYDLAIAVALFVSLDICSQEFVKQFVFIGELNLDGKLHGVSGVLPRVYTAYENGIHTCVVPEENVAEASMVRGMDVVGVSTLTELVQMLKEEKITVSKAPESVGKGQKETLNFADVNGQKIVRRAVEVAVAGMHNILLIGPPGSGKTMIAKRIPSIMPELTFDEKMEISKIYSVAGLLSAQCPVIEKRPFREPHHTITQSALIGGGHLPKPGEISLASGGVLFLDELPEFPRQNIEVLRQPLEDGYVMVNRVDGAYRYPAKCQLVAAMNPCRCGYFPDRRKCSCSVSQIKNYRNKVSQPMLDRIDICAETLPLHYNDFENKQDKVKNESSESIRERIVAAQKIQNERYKEENIYHNSDLNPTLMDKYCVCTKQAKEYLEQSFSRLDFSARVYHKILKVSRTIADLAGEDIIRQEHVAEAVCYRMIDKKYWGDDDF